MPLRNAEPTLVMKKGFVELPGLLSESLCGTLSNIDIGTSPGRIKISNATEVDIKHLEEWQRVHDAIAGHSILEAAVRCAFGVAEFELAEAKLLEAEPSAPAQIPHADAINNLGGFFGVVHLRPSQAATLAHPYDAQGVAELYVTCEASCHDCGTQIRLTDEQARRREHLRLGEPWTCSCSDAGRDCMPAGRRQKSARKQGAPSMGEAVCHGKAFAPLLNDPEGVVERMQPLGTPTPEVGDAVLALPTLLHHGPGGSGSTTARRVLFFFVRPVFSPERFRPMPEHELAALLYDPSSQVQRARGLPTAGCREAAAKSGSGEAIPASH